MQPDPDDAPPSLHAHDQGPPRPAFPWDRSLRFRMACGLVALFVGLVAVSLGVIWWQGLPLLIQESRQLNRQIGENLAATLSQQFKQAATLSRAIAQVAETLPYDDATYRQLIPHLLDVPELRTLIAGGGLWPEPRVFDPNRDRLALFWGRDQAGVLQFFDNYNDPAGNGYHKEEWYVPARLQPRDQAYWSRSYTDPYSLQPMVTCTTPFRRAGVFAGVATVDLKLEGVNALLQEKFRDRPGYAFVVDRNNKFIAFPQLELVRTERADIRNSGTPTADFSFVGELALVNPVFQPVAEQLTLLNQRDSSQADQDSEAVQTLAQAIHTSSYQIDRAEAGVIAHNLMAPESGKPVTLAQFSLDDDILLRQPADVVIHQMPHTSWKIVSVFPQTETTRSAMTISRSLTLGSLAGISLAGALFALFLWRVLLRRLAQMTRQIQDAAEQDVTQRISLVRHRNEDELDLLAHWYNQRTRQLHAALLAAHGGTHQLAQENAAHRTTTSLLEKTLTLQRTLLDSANLVILRLDHDGMIQHCNAGVTRFLGYRETELIGKMFPQPLIDPEQLQTRQQELRHQLDHPLEGFSLFSAMPEARQWTLKHKDGHTVRMLVDISPVQDANDPVGGWVVVGTDISRQVQPLQIPEDVATPEPESKSDTTPPGASSSLSSPSSPSHASGNSSASPVFLMQLAQELRATLASLLGFTHQLQKKFSANEALASIERNAGQLLALANGLLELSRLDAGQPELTPAEFNLSELVDEVHTELRPLLEGKPVDYGYHVPKDPVLMQADRRKIRQILFNLLSHAIRTTDHGSIDVTLTHSDTSGHVRLILSDTGRGFSAETSQRLFQADTPLDGYVGQPPGQGLDLFLTGQLVRLHQGTISVGNAPGKTTRITLDLPLHPAAAPDMK
ncbi:MAG TPA: ATP-binding protein [Dongiaceae bacterium]|nr:ATP-binding protein [Dongiaceae bacterium]